MFILGELHSIWFEVEIFKTFKNLKIFNKKLNNYRIEPNNLNFNLLNRKIMNKSFYQF